jgi:hypothetical protein
MTMPDVEVDGGRNVYVTVEPTLGSTSTDVTHDGRASERARHPSAEMSD